MDERQRHLLSSQLAAARQRSDEIFRLIRPGFLYERPIPERHRLVFYLGHLEAFDWNLLCRPVSLKSRNERFDQLFAFGIDPTNGGLPQDRPDDWPGEAEVRAYNDAVRQAVDGLLQTASSPQLFQVAVEHRLMHAETLTYMLQWLPFEMKRAGVPAGFSASRPAADRVEIPRGIATLGMRRESGEFGWDNEFSENTVSVPEFAIDRYKTTNAEFAEFVRAGGYDDPSLWSEAGWNWIREAGIRHPRFWRRDGESWLCRTMFADVPFQPAWPVYVSHSEASAYARWKGKALPTESQFHRAAYGTAGPEERQFPWGGEAPQARHGNFNFASWDPAAVDAYPEGDSAFGVRGLVGNGWEWTSTPFEPFAGFEPFPFYPGYSADFFDGNHYVMKGGSARTSALLLRRSFRNWFQPLYPNIYASFRCVEN